MKKLLGILTLIIVMSGPAWAWDNFSVTIGNTGAALWYNSGNGYWDADTDRSRETRRRHRVDRSDKRVGTVDHRLERQKTRIRDGRENGNLTRKEFRHLKRDHRRILNYRQAALGDGRLSPREWRNLTAMLDQAGERIKNLRSNRRKPENRWPRSRPYARSW